VPLCVPGARGCLLAGDACWLACVGPHPPRRGRRPRQLVRAAVPAGEGIQPASNGPHLGMLLGHGFCPRGPPSPHSTFILATDRLISFRAQTAAFVNSQKFDIWVFQYFFSQSSRTYTITYSHRSHFEKNYFRYT
jgi:hypothetical protein